MSTQGVYLTDTKNGTRSFNRTEQSSQNAKTLAACLPFITKMTDYQLKRLQICPNGEFHTCSNGKEALDMVNHIKTAFRSRGFGCYALHNYVWIVPFVHQSLHLPDFERAKSVLPDLKSELLGKAFPDEDLTSPKKTTFNFKFDKKCWIALAIIVGILVIVL